MSTASKTVANEPVAFSALVTAALIATVNLVAWLFEWSETVTQLVNICVAAWVLVAAAVVRHFVTPVAKQE